MRESRVSTVLSMWPQRKPLPKGSSRCVLPKLHQSLPSDLVLPWLSHHCAASLPQNVPAPTTEDDATQDMALQSDEEAVPKLGPSVPALANPHTLCLLPDLQELQHDLQHPKDSEDACSDEAPKAEVSALILIEVSHFFPQVSPTALAPSRTTSH